MTTQQTPDQLFGLAVKDLRERRGWSMSELARALSEAGLSNFHATTISRLESGARAVRLSEAVVIADVFGVSLGYMVSESSPDGGNDFVIPNGKLLPELAQKTLLSLATVMATTAREESQHQEKEDKDE